MTAREWTGAASSAEDAVRKGVRKMGLTRDQVNIRVLEEKTSDLFSLFGFRRVKVKLTVKPSVLRELTAHASGEDRDHQNDHRHDRGFRDDEDPRHGSPYEEDRHARPRNGRFKDRKDRNGRDRNAPANPAPASRRERPARDDRPRRAEETRRPPVDERVPSGPVTAPEVFVEQWKSLLGWNDLAWSVREEDGDIILHFDAASGERLAANGALLLKALEHLLNTVRAKESRTAPRVFLEVEGLAPEPRPKARPFEDRRPGGSRPERSRASGGRLENVARQAAEEVVKTGRPVKLEPMPARERKVIHKVLAGRKDVETSSEGREPHRRVVVSPTED